MTNESGKYHRRSIRLKGYDYTQAGAYFVTICTQDHKCMFGEILDGEIHLDDVGQLIQSIWITLPERFPDVELDQYTIMPNHLHGIITLAGTGFTAHQDTYTSRVPDRFEQQMYTKSQSNLSPALGEIIRTFKAITAYRIHAAGATDFAWQRNYHEHIARKEGNLNGIRQYIIDNPIRWKEDEFYL